MLHDKIITKSEKETFAFARKFASGLSGGEVLALYGDLGSGKTAFTKGLAKGLGVKNIITSPTFVLMKVYDYSRNKKLVHIDAYRLGGGNDLEMIGASDYFGDKNSVVVIEWAEKVKGILPKNVVKIKFKVLSGDKRQISIL